jgi:hypothetical protein
LQALFCKLGFSPPAWGKGTGLSARQLQLRKRTSSAGGLLHTVVL